MMKTTDQKINSLRNGGTVTIGRSNGIEVVVEKSGNFNGTFPESEQLATAIALAKGEA